MTDMHKVNWLEKAVFYNIYPQSFYDTNGDGIGDLNGIRAKLTYIRDMGFNALWLNPFYESPFRDAGYDVTDFYKVAPRYGTNGDFRALCREAHEMGIKVCIDLVAGHTSLECQWFQRSCETEPNEYWNRYVWTDSWDKDYHSSCVGGYSQRNGMFMKNFFYCQPALNYGFAQIDDPTWQLPMDHPDCVATKQELLRIMDHWIGLGADGFRVDMAASLIKNDPTGEGIARFWQEIRQIFDEKYPECVLISEWSNPTKAIGAGFHIDFLIHFNLAAYTKLFRAEKGRSCGETFLGDSFFHRDGNGRLADFLSDYARELSETQQKGYISIPTGNHDLPRISYRRTKPELEVAYAFLLTMPGVPFVYYGDEIGMPYRDDLPSKEGGFNRTGARTPMQWEPGTNAGFSTAPAEMLYLPVDENGVNVAQQLSDPDSLLNTTKGLIALRKASSALCADGRIDFVNRKFNGYPMVYRRFDDTEEYLICINPTGRTDRWEMECSAYTLVDTNRKDVCCTGSLEMPPFSYFIWKKK